jgi:glycosyl transferase family 25
MAASEGPRVMATAAVPIFVISVPDAAARRAHMARQLSGLGVSYTVVDGVTPADLGLDARSISGTPQPHLGRPLSLTEIACLESHVAVLARVCRERPPVAIVLEDDVACAPDLARVLADLDASPPSWDVLLLGHHSARHGPSDGAETMRRREPLTPRRSVARVVEFAMGAYAYAVTPRGAERLIAHARPLRMPMDWVTGYAPVAGVRLSAVVPPAVTPDARIADQSTIDGRDSGAPPDGATPSRMRRLGGHAFLAIRRSGLWANGYVRHY